MAQLPTGIVGHTRKVCSLYKRALRTLGDWHTDIAEYRYEAVMMRQRFEKNRNEPDMRVAKKLLLEGEEELFQKEHYQPRKFPSSPGGLAYERYQIPPDWIVDFWDPMEKARFPKYFAQREKLKKEYVELYHKLYPEPSGKK